MDSHLPPQTLMSVQAMMVDVIRCVPTLKGALCVLVILDTNEI